MTVKYGFFNSSNGDRVYDAEDFSRFFDGIIFDGVYSAVGNRFNVEAAGGMLVTVDTGRAWFDHTWTFNDQKFALMIPDADTVYSRIDAVVIEVNKDQRKNFIKVIQGTPAATPQRPSMSRSDTVTQYALAYVTVPANASSISTENIAYVVDTSETPLCSALNLAGLPSGGTIGQVLAKKSASSGDVGWYNVSALPYSKWYLANGITESNVLAAFRFVNRLNETQALEQVNEQYLVTGSAISLTKGGSAATWNTSTGFYLPWKSYLDNATLRSASVMSIVMRVTDISTTNGNWDGWSQKSALPLIGNCITGRKMAIWASMPFMTRSYDRINSNALSTSGENGSDNVASLKTTGSYYTSGTIGYSKTDDILYRNGAQATRTRLTSSNTVNGYAPSNFVADSVAKLVGGTADTSDTTSWNGLGRFHWGGSFRVQYLALYNVNLSAAQHSAIYNQIEADILS